MKERVHKVEDEMVAVRSTAQTSATLMEMFPSKIKIHDPKPLNGVRNAKELKTFMWDMEQYFNTAYCPEHEKITIISMYLMGDAKLWWRTKLQDDENSDIPRIDMWEWLKKELKDQFRSYNTA